eukprot:Hpha_TRINITY_DN16730_c3_g6::TRINITY_DN16730_c3_g6_i1::g.79764::m.79764
MVPRGANDGGVGEDRAHPFEDTHDLGYRHRGACVVGRDEAGQRRSARDYGVVRARETAVGVELTRERNPPRRVTLRLVVQHQDFFVANRVVPPPHGGVGFHADKVSRDGAVTLVGVTHVSEDVQRGCPCLLQLRDAGARETGYVNVRPYARRFGNVVTLVERGGDVEQTFEHRWLADDPRVHVHRRSGPQQIAAAHSGVEGGDLTRGRAFEVARIQRAPIPDGPGDTVHVQAGNPRVNRVRKTPIAAAGGVGVHLLSETDRPGNEVVEVLLDDLGGEPVAESLEAQSLVEADVQVVREHQVHICYSRGFRRARVRRWGSINRAYSSRTKGEEKASAPRGCHHLPPTPEDSNANKVQKL